MFGMYSITFVLSLFASGLALAVRDRRATLTAAGVVAAVCIIDLLFAATRLATQQVETVRVAPVGPVTTDDEVGSLAAGTHAAATYAPRLESLARQGAKLIVTPEESLTAQHASLTEALAPLQAVSQATGAEIVAGVLQLEPAGDIAVAFAPDGRSTVYAKRR